MRDSGAVARLEYVGFKPLTSILPLIQGRGGKTNAVRRHVAGFINIPETGSYSLVAEAAFYTSGVVDLRSGKHRGDSPS